MNDLRKLGNIENIAEIGKNRLKLTLVPSFTGRNKTLVLVVKNCAKWDFKVFCSHLDLFESLKLFHKFFSRLSVNNFLLLTLPEDFNILISFIPCLQSLFQTFNPNIKWTHCRKVLNRTVSYTNKKHHQKASSKSIIRKLSILVGDVFSVEPSFLSKTLHIFRNLNHD